MGMLAERQVELTDGRKVMFHGFYENGTYGYEARHDDEDNDAFFADFYGDIDNEEDIVWFLHDNGMNYKRIVF